MSAAEPPGYVRNRQGGVKVKDIWWGLDGQLHATIASWSCDLTRRFENDKMIRINTYALWRLDGQRWVSEDRVSASIVRQLSRGGKLALQIPECLGPVGSLTNPDRPDFPTYCNTGKLYRDYGGQQVLVAEGVIGILTPEPGVS